MKEKDMEISKIIKRIRKLTGYTQQELAAELSKRAPRKIKFSQQAIGQYEAGAISPVYPRFRKIIELLQKAEALEKRDTHGIIIAVKNRLAEHGE